MKQIVNKEKRFSDKIKSAIRVNSDRPAFESFNLKSLTEYAELSLFVQETEHIR